MNQPIDIQLKSLALAVGLDAEEPLLALERRVQELYRSAAGSNDDEHIARIGREIDDLEAEICQAVPSTLGGIAVKVRHLWNCAKEHVEPDDELNVRTTLEALGRLAESADEAVEVEHGEVPNGRQTSDVAAAS